MANSTQRNWKAQLRNAATDALQQRKQAARKLIDESMNGDDKTPAPSLNRPPIRPATRIDQDRDS